MTSRLKKGVLAMHLTRKDMRICLLWQEGACAQNCFIGGWAAFKVEIQDHNQKG